MKLCRVLHVAFSLFVYGMSQVEAADLTQSITVPSLTASNIPFVGVDIDHGRGDGTYVVFHDWRNVAGQIMGPNSFIDKSDGTHVVVGFSIDGQGNFYDLNDGNGGADIAQFLTSNVGYVRPFLVQAQSQAGPNAYTMFPVTAVIAAPATHGVFQFVVTNAIATQYKQPLNGTYTPNDGFTGQDTVTINYVMNGSVALTAALTITVANTPPTVTMTQVSEPVLPGQNIAFAANAADADHNLSSFVWDFGDGTNSSGSFVSGISADASTTHTYATPGVYQATITVTDAGGLSTSSTQSVTIFSTNDEPQASFVTSAVNATVNAPLGFDATFSTDPANKITAYSWDFVDGTPSGIGVLISHIYRSTGIFVTTLTVTDSNGLTNNVSAAIVVVESANGAATPFVSYTAKFNRKVSGHDSLNVIGQFNPGTVIAPATNLGVTVGSSNFSGTISGRNTHIKWSVKAVKQVKGSVVLRGSVKNVSLVGLPSQSGTFTVPVRLTIGDLVFSTPVTNTFRFGLGGGNAGPK